MGDLRDLERLELEYLERLAERASAMRALTGRPAPAPMSTPMPATPTPHRGSVPAPFAAGSSASSSAGGEYGELMHLAAAVLEAEGQAWTRWADALARKAADDEPGGDRP